MEVFMRSLSGIQPSGILHIGNYFGAIKQFVELQDEYEGFYFLANYHALTSSPKGDDLKTNTINVILDYLALGLDPEKSTLYIQSDVPEVAELTLLLNNNSYLGELMRTTSFKEKARQQPENVNAGLLTYPVLMCADIIIHHAQKVPVGKDQEQNLEMARKFAQRFNNMYNVEYFPIPQPFNYGESLIKIPGLDGSGKMGKSEGNGIFLAEDPASIRKKVMKAVTDSGPTAPNAVMPEVIQNLFTIMNVVSTPDTVNYFTDKWNSCEIRYGDFKKQLAEDIVQFTEPIRNKINDIKNDEVYLSKVVAMGREKAHESAAKRIKEVREIIGFKRF